MSRAGRYQLLDRIATGGMAELYRARVVGAEGFTKILAIKRIRPDLANDEMFVQMLIKEARMAANLSHPNITQVFELGRDENGFFIAMEFVNGPNLAALLRKMGEQGRRLPEPCSLDIVIQLLLALDYAHRFVDSAGSPQSLVHQDVSPENLLVSLNGVVKLTDFGVARIKTIRPQTRGKGVRGKLPYMAPEQITGKEIDGRTDIFAAGLVLWECLAGRMHYDSENEPDLIEQVSKGRVRSLAEIGVEVASEIEAVLARALAHDPENRYSTASAFAEDLILFHRRTYPIHSPAVLGGLVDELFREKFEVLSERLRKFESGVAAPSGVVGGDEPPLVATPSVSFHAQVLTPAIPTLENEASSGLNPIPRRGGRNATSIPLLTADLAVVSRERTNIPAILLVVASMGALAVAGVTIFLHSASRPTAVAIDLEPTAMEAGRREEVSSATLRSTAPGAKRGERRDPPRPRMREFESGLSPQGTSSGSTSIRRSGWLDLDCRPQCEVEIDGRKVGSSPLKRFPLEAGTHRVRAVNRFVNLRKQRIIEIQADKTTFKLINLVTDP